MATVATTGAPSPQPGMLKGFYNKHSSTQGTVVAKCEALLAQAAEQVPLPNPGQALHIAEWGCAHGGNSIAPVVTICEGINKRLLATSTDSNAQQQLQHRQQVHVTHTDVTGNSWTELFQCAQRYQQQVHQEMPQLQVTFAGIGSSQYLRNHPDRVLDVGFSFNAMHWLSRRPCYLKHCMSPFCSRVLPEEVSALRAQAREDLVNFLTLRADEFKPGGLLVMSYGTLNSESRRWLELVNGPQTVAEQLVAEGLLKEDELGALAAPVYFLDEEAQRQVFAELADKWELVHYDEVSSLNPDVETTMVDGIVSTACGEVIANFIKAAMCPFMEAELKATGRDQQAVNALLDTFFSRLAQHVAKNPVPAGYPSTRVLLRRRG